MGTRTELERLIEQADKSYDILAKENEALLLRADRLEAQNKELKKRIEDFKVHTKSLDDIILKLKDENNKLQQWTLNDRKVRHGFELAIETLKKCKESDTE